VGVEDCDTLGIMDFKTFLRPGRGTADLSWLLADSVAFHELIDRIVDLFEDVEVDKVVCIEGKGLVFGAAVARTLRKGVILLRRRSKLRSKAYVLDYIDYSGGRKTLGVLDDLVLKGERVLIIDDWIETGGYDEGGYICD